MPIVFRCDHCRQKLSISSRKAGTQLTCPKCAQEVTVPVPQGRQGEKERPAGAQKESPLPPTRELPNTKQREDEIEDRRWAATREFRERPQRPRDLAETAPLQPSASPVIESPPEKPARPIAPSAPRSTELVEEEEFQLRRPQTNLEEMDLTPMVDVTFLLLIFFMITASFSLTKTIETPAPDPESKGAQTLQNLEELEKTSITVRIDEQDNIFIVDDEVYDSKPVDPADLEDVLGDKLRQEQKNELIIQASTQSRHEAFVNVFDAATGAGMQKIRLAAARAEE